MASVIQAKYSATASAAPTTDDLTVAGEIALNLTDKKLYSRDTTDAIVQIGEQDGDSDGAVKYWSVTDGEWAQASNLTITHATGAVNMNAAANIIITGLPTSDPLVSGALWNDSGTLKVSAG